VSAEVEGCPLWFESSDISLRPAPEAFGCALVPAAVEQRADLAFDAPVDPRWIAHVGALQHIWRQWWRIRQADIRPRTEERSPLVRAKGVGLCFSGGVDSFYSLLRSGFAFDHLVSVHGYDVKLSDTRRSAAAEQSLREVAAAVGAKPVTVRTNLREHPTFAGADWERSHGGALAALGHLLGDDIGILVISSSDPYHHDAPWGSHWKTDPLWSSSRIEIVHSGAGLWRNEKLQLIAGEDLVRRHLRVCWENRRPAGNCGHCEKCVRTMFVLAQAHQLEHFPVFDGAAPVRERIHQLPRIAPALFPDYEELLRQCTDPFLAEALRALLARSRTVRSPSVCRALAHRLPEVIPMRWRYGRRYLPAW